MRRITSLSPTLRTEAVLAAVGWVIAMTLFVVLFFPETRGVPIERLEEVSVQ